MLVDSGGRKDRKDHKASFNFLFSSSSIANDVSKNPMLSLRMDSKDGVEGWVVRREGWFIGYFGMMIDTRSERSADCSFEKADPRAVERREGRDAR